MRRFRNRFDDRPPDNDSYMMREQLQKIESGTVLTVIPHIGDNNDITLEMAVEVSDSIPRGRGGSDLPLITRRTVKNALTVKDGGTVAVTGLIENRGRSSEKRVPGWQTFH
jgi:type II secretory pathway component GspD/PulD (secretin)